VPKETHHRIELVFYLVRVVKAFPIRWPEGVHLEVIDELNELLARYPKVFKFQMGDVWL